jgi:hypothetical protein
MKRSGHDEVIRSHELDKFVGYAGSFSATTALDVGEYLIQLGRMWRMIPISRA